MDRQAVLTTIQEVAPEILGVEPEVVVEEASFKDDLDADSLDLVELVMKLEERCGITIPEDELSQIETVAQAVDLVVGKLAVRT